MTDIDDLIARLESYENRDGFNRQLADALREQREAINAFTRNVEEPLREVARLKERAERAEAAQAQQEPQGLEGWGLLLKAPIVHTRSCSCVTLPDGKGKEWCAEDERCTCGYEWRVRLATYMTMYNAWRKRAGEAEAERDALRDEAIGYTPEHCRIHDELRMRAEKAEAELADVKVKWMGQIGQCATLSTQIDRLEAERDALRQLVVEVLDDLAEAKWSMGTDWVSRAQAASGSSHN